MSAARPARLRVALFGSPPFALPTLEALHARHELVLVVSQPDKPAGRGMALRSPAVAERARALALPLAQPRRLRGNEPFRERLAGLDLDVAVTAAYGRILPPTLLEVPRHGFLNVHASLLPAYRGAAPIQWALIRGERETGISIMQTEEGLDTGPVRHVARTAIGPEETAPELTERLAELGARAMVEALDLLLEGELPCVPQDEARASHAPPLTKGEGRIRWQDGAQAVFDRHRGVQPWPGSFFQHGDKPVRVPGLVTDAGSGAAGELLEVAGGGVSVACGEGAIRLLELRPAGKRTMPADAWARGARLRPGDRLA